MKKALFLLINSFIIRIGERGGDWCGQSGTGTSGAEDSRLVSRCHCIHAVLFSDTAFCVNKYVSPVVTSSVCVCETVCVFSESIWEKQGVWRGKRKEKSICLTLCSAATAGCVQVSHCVSLCPNCKGATKCSKLFKWSFRDRRLMCKERWGHEREKRGLMSDLRQTEKINKIN